MEPTVLITLLLCNSILGFVLAFMYVGDTFPRTKLEVLINSIIFMLMTISGVFTILFFMVWGLLKVLKRFWELPIR
jgi:hypothetical protein